MINRVVLVGRLTRDIEVKTVGANNIENTRFSIACDRIGDGTDFINCVAWRQSAKFLGQYAHKGDVIAIDGHITTGSYDGQNGKVFTTDVTCDSVRLIGSKSDHKAEQSKESLHIETDDLPFY